MHFGRLLPAVALAGLVSTTGLANDEVRAIWVTRWDYRTEQDVVDAVHNAASLGLSRIYFQVRGRADAFYRSNLEPWGEELGPNPTFDPLEVAVREARRTGVELHAWANVMSGWKGRRPPRDRRHVVYRHPEWFLYDRFGKRHLYDDHYTILNPCSEPARAHLRAVFHDIAKRYAVDGIHLDYIRFIAESEKARQAVPYDNRTLARFRRMTGGFPVRHPREWNEFRREAITTLVRDLSLTIQKARPGCHVSAAVIRDFDGAKKRYFQDARKWLQSGYVAELVPMNYERKLDRFNHHLENALASGSPDSIVCGVGVYLVDDPRVVVRQIEAARRRGAGGYALFGYANFFRSPSHESAGGVAAERTRVTLQRAVRELNRAVAVRR